MPAPLVLAIESATADASVALLRGEAVLEARRVPAEHPASERLLPCIVALLADLDVSLGTLDAFAISVGPGSFTGLRVGVATLKGLAFASAQPVVPVPTLAALALRAAPRGDALVAALLDARRGEVYAALYGGEPVSPPSLGPTVLRPDALVEAIEAHAAGRSIVAIGDGCGVVAAALHHRFGARATCLAPPAGATDAAAVGVLAQRLLTRGVAIRAEALAPVYVRRAEAEVLRTGAALEAPSDAL